MPKISKRVTDAAHPRPDRYILWDTELKGFGLLVLPSGVKSYFYQYRTPEGRQRRATIGRHGEWTPAQARKKADECRQLVRSGRDPLGEKRALRLAPTVGDLLEAYLSSQSFKEKAASTQAIDHGRIERHLRPLLAKKHAHLLTSEDVRRALAYIRRGKTAADIKTRKRGRARVRGGEGTARMAIDLLRTIFNWALEERLVKENPCSGIKTGASGTRDTIIDNPADYCRLFDALDRLESQRRLRAPVADAIRLIALTGCRRGEAAGLRWEHVDLRRGRILLPPQSHKTGRKTGKPREIILPAAAQAIIAWQREGKPNQFVFMPAGGNGPIALSKPWRMVREEAQLPRSLGLHGVASNTVNQNCQAPF
jgi:integrase